MSARKPTAPLDPKVLMEAEIATVNADMALAEGTCTNSANADAPLNRRIVVSIRASLNDLCLSKNQGVWSPSPEALKAILQQRRFTALDGTSEMQGNLRSIMLHSLDVTHAASSFPFSIGARITGVDDATFASSGEAYSTILLPNSSSTTSKTLQVDDTSLAYEFAKKFPGYTSENLSTQGVHEVNQRKFVLVSADHPIVSAISENAHKLQMGEISMMPEGLVKISSGLYESILPLVTQQVESQIKVRDFSKASVSISPAEHASWSDARAELLVERKRPLKAQLQAELGAARDEDHKLQIREAFTSREAALEHSVDFEIRNFDIELAVKYNFLDNHS